VVDLDGQRTRHVLDRDRRLGGRIGRRQRIAHHAVGTAIDDSRHAPRFAGAVEGNAQLHAADQCLYVIQARHASLVVRDIFEKTLMAPEM
jgi:hypothetical protein